MSDVFGSISSDFLPEDFGKDPSEVVKQASSGYGDTQGELDDLHLGGWLSDRRERKDAEKAEEEAAEAAESVDSKLADSSSRSGVEFSTFWANLAGGGDDYRDLTTAIHGIYYRQYTDGSVEIIGPATAAIGTKWGADTETAKQVNKAAGLYAGDAGVDRSAALAAGAGVVSQILPGLLAILGGGDLPVVAQEREKEKEPFPLALVLIGVGVVAATVTGVIAIKRLGQDDEEAE
jgi:hypothetical protein